MEAEKAWHENDIEYQKYLSKISWLLPTSIQHFLLYVKSLHDSQITEISFFQAGTDKSCKIVLISSGNRVELYLQGIRRFGTCFESFKYAVGECLSWGYCEIKRIDRNNYRLSVLCDPQNELLVEFEELRFFVNTDDGTAR